MRKFFLLIFFILCFSGYSATIRLKNCSFNPSDGVKVDGLFAEKNIGKEKKGLFLIQFNGEITEEDKAFLKQSGLKIVDYVPENTFVVFGKKEIVDNLKKSSISWRGYLHPYFRISKNLIEVTKRAIKEKSKNIKTVIVLFYPFMDKDECRHLIEGAGGKVIEVAKNRWQIIVKAEIEEAKLRDVSFLNGVKWIEEFKPIKIMGYKPVIKSSSGIKNHVSADIVNIKDVWYRGYTGLGQIVGIMDTGLDIGSLYGIHPDFDDDDNPETPSTKIVSAYGLSRENEWSDPDSHGTHTSGSLCGDGSSSDGKIKGMAYDARMVMESVYPERGSAVGLISVPLDIYNEAFFRAYRDGARVHSNSWGGKDNQYDSHAVQVDQMMWDYKDFLVVFAVGNQGADSDKDGVVDLGSVHAPTTAKNCITVGGTESNQPEIKSYYGDSYGEPIASDLDADNPDGMVAFSSRGPTSDGRIKPDICAPATWIVSTLSQYPDTHTFYGDYDKWYAYDSGTSMACPMVAGAAAVLRQYFMEEEDIIPSAALIKATLLNAAYDIFPGQYGTGKYQEIPELRPNNVEGWGRLNVADAILPQGNMRLSYDDERRGITTNTVVSYKYTVEDTSYPLKITLTWTDYPGALFAEKCLVNDLDLIIETPEGEILYPNHLNCEDRLNNVETIDIFKPVKGDYIVRVVGHNIPMGPQPYAIVAHGTSTLQKFEDNTPPVVKDVKICVADDSSVVYVETNEPSKIKIEFGKESPYENILYGDDFSTYFSVPLKGLSEGTRYYFRVTLTDYSGNEAVSKVKTFVTARNEIKEVVFSDNMEGTTSNWYVSSMSIDFHNQWKITGAKSFSGLYSYYCNGNDTMFWDRLVEDGYNYFFLESMPVLIDSDVSEVYLEFYHYYNLAENDYCFIEISDNGGEYYFPVEDLIVSEEYNGVFTPESFLGQGDFSCWKGSNGGEFKKVKVDLSPFAGKEVSVRFVFVDHLDGISEGWFVDDVKIVQKLCNQGEPHSVYLISATAGENGTISPAEQVYVKEGENMTFTFNPDEGFVVENVKVDGEDIGAVSEYTFHNVQSSHTLEVTFKEGEEQYSIKVEKNNDFGWIRPEGTIFVKRGEDLSIEFKANPSYGIQKLNVDGINLFDSTNIEWYLENSNVITFENINDNHSVYIIFSSTPVPQFIRANVNTTEVKAGEVVNFDCKAIDPEGETVYKYVFFFYDETNNRLETGISVTGRLRYRFTYSGEYKVVIKAYDIHKEFGYTVLKDSSGKDIVIKVVQ